MSMRYPYRDLGVTFDRQFRNDLNANFDDIEHDIRMLGGEAAQQALEAAEEANTQAIYAQTSGDYAQDKGDYAAQQGDYAKTQGDYAKVQGDYAKAQGDYAKQVADANKTRLLAPVANYAAIATTYPNPQFGDTVQTLDDGKFYRYENGQWNFKEQYTGTAINSIVNELSKQNKQSAIIGHGLNVINASQNSPLDIRIEGRTLVNLLGTQGRTATSATVTLDPAKYYVLVNEDGTNVTVDGVSQTVPYKFTGKSSVSLSWTSGKVALYEVDAAEYNNILTTWTASEVNRRYPYVDSVQHVQNPYILAEGENLLPPFTEWNLHANARVKSAYELELNATGEWQATQIIINASSNTPYTLLIESTGGGRVYYRELDANSNTINAPKSIAVGIPISFTTSPNTRKLQIIVDNGNTTSGTFTFTNPMLTLGSTAKPFVPRNPSYLFAEVKLGSLGDKKDILWKDGQDWKVTKWVEKDVVLDGKLSWSFMGDYTGYKRFNYAGLSNTLPNINENFVLTKFDGKKLKFRTDSNWQTDEAYCFNNTVSISVSDTDTGWSEHYKPSQQEIQAYFNGWKANGYTTGIAVTNELTGQLAPSGTYQFAQNGAYRNVVVEKSTDGSTWLPATEGIDFKIDISGTKAVLTNLSLSPLYFRISYNYGVTVNSWASLVDGSAPATNTLTYVSANLAPNFTPYKLSYVRSTPVTEVVTDKVEGDLVVNGATQVEVGSGFTYTEVDGKRTYTKLAQNSRYNVTANILSVIANYDTSLKSVVDSLIAKQSDIASTVSVNVRAIAELYKRVKALGG